jgi:hypothetical protein
LFKVLLYIDIIRQENIKKKVTSLLESNDRWVILVFPDITAKAAARATTASFVFRTASAPDRNFSISCGDTSSKALFYY